MQQTVHGTLSRFKGTLNQTLETIARPRLDKSPIVWAGGRVGREKRTLRSEPKRYGMSNARVQPAAPLALTALYTEP